MRSSPVTGSSSTASRGAWRPGIVAALSIHRADLHGVLADAVRERLGPDALILDHKCVGAEQDDTGVTARFTSADGARAPPHAATC